MNLQTYLQMKSARAVASYGRELCVRCLQPDYTCFCETLRPFDPGIKFVILIHPKEVRRKIATGRLSHMSMHGSHLIPGLDFSANAELNALLAEPSHQPVVLYPSRDAVNLSQLDTGARRALIPPGKQLLFIVIDGTWSTARKMIRLSQNLEPLPRVCFSPNRPSTFRVRKQPRPECVSTIEAIHEVLELLDTARGRQHRLLEAFDRMVERRLELGGARRVYRHRR